MAPPKPFTQKERTLAASYLLELIESLHQPTADPCKLEQLSIVKGLFNRVLREDQWDWFTVMGQLGFPSAGLARRIALEITDLRIAIRDGNGSSVETSRTNLLRLPTRRCLSVFLGQSKIIDEQNAGWIYILSTREMPDILKIGMTTRTVEERAREINAATGVVIPFGVRRCWRVGDPGRAERIAHTALAEHRLRKDREFFRVDFRVAASRIQSLLTEANLELRTLDNLAALS